MGIPGYVARFVRDLYRKLKPFVSSNLTEYDVINRVMTAHLEGKFEGKLRNESVVDLDELISLAYEEGILRPPRHEKAYKISELPAELRAAANYLDNQTKKLREGGREPYVDE